MRRLFGSRVTGAVAVAVLTLAAVGGGYAVASGGAKKIKACVSRHTHVLYVGKCKSHDKKLSWNQIGPQGPQGPQGPGAKKLVFDGIGTASPTPTTLGSMGPWTLTASCSLPTAGTTVAHLYLTGPGGRLDAMEVSGSGTSSASAGSGSFPPLSSVDVFGGTSSNSTSATSVAAQVLWLPTSGSSVQTQIVAVATGGTINTCHESVVVIPVS